jgi:hypothetical protein
MIQAEPWEIDDGCLRVPWREVGPIERSLRIGVILEDQKRPLHPPMLRTINTAIDSLKAQGHYLETLDDKLPSLWDMTVQAWKYFMLDPQGTPFKNATAGGEPLVKSIGRTRSRPFMTIPTKSGRTTFQEHTNFGQSRRSSLELLNLMLHTAEMNPNLNLIESPAIELALCPSRWIPRTSHMCWQLTSGVLLGFLDSQREVRTVA